MSSSTSSPPRTKMASGAGQSRGASVSRNAKQLLQEVDAFSEEELAQRPEVRIINKYAVVLAYIRIGLKGIGALALLWATVVLLGGFVSSLGRTDFWSLTIISFVQAAGLSDATGDDRFAFFGEWLSSLKKNLQYGGERKHHDEHTTLSEWLPRAISTLASKIVDLIMFVIFFPVASFALAGPIICVTLSAIRVRKQDYGIDKGDASKANLKPALNLFYYVSLVHGALYLTLLLAEVAADQYVLEIVSQQHGFSTEIIDGYLDETKQMCVNNPASTKNWNLITYGAGLLDSQLPEDYSAGGRVLTMLTDQDTPVPIRRLLIRSPRQRIQKLILTLAWRSPEEREMRWLAARIVEHLAGDLSLAEFPEALPYMSSLLDNSCHNNGDQEALHLPFEIGRSKARKRKSYLAQVALVDHQLEDEDGSPKAKSLVKVLYNYIQECIHNIIGAPMNGGRKKQDDNQGGDQDLVLPGLRILDNLAHDGHNCTMIYNNKGLLTKLVAPVSSKTFIEDTESNAAWTKIVDGSLKVVSRLMSSPGNTGEEMRSQIAVDANAVKNLEVVLGMDMQNNNSIIELQIRAMEVLAQLVLHHLATSATGTREHLIERALHLFITNNWMEGYLNGEKRMIDKEIADQNTELSRTPTVGFMDNIAKRVRGEWAKVRIEMEAKAAEAHAKKKMKQAKGTVSRLKEKAGEVLAMLSMGNGSNSECSRSFIKSENVIDRLTELLDSNIKTIQCRISATETVEVDITMGCRISAAVILKQSSNHLKEETLRKAIVESLPIQASDTSARRWWEHVSGCISAANKNDEENPSDGRLHRPPTVQSHMQKSEERRLQAELLSLIAAIRASGNLNFASVMLQPHLVSTEDVVVRLKKMVENNMYATPACLAILKITSEIVIEFILHDGNAEVIEKHDIVGTLFNASKRMATLESGMIFAGDNHDCYGIPLKPLSSVLVKEAQDLLTKRKEDPGINTPAGRS